MNYVSEKIKIRINKKVAKVKQLQNEIEFLEQQSNEAKSIIDKAITNGWMEKGDIYAKCPKCDRLWDPLSHNVALAKNEHGEKCTMKKIR